MTLRPTWAESNNPFIEHPYYRRPTNMSYFAYRLRTEPEDPDYLEAEEFYYECKYEIKKYKE